MISAPAALSADLRASGWSTGTPRVEGYSLQVAGACIGIAHPKWDERPLLVVVRKPGAQVTRDELLGFYEGRVAKWQTPDDVAFVDSIPMGPTGKMLKNKLREQFKGYKLPSA